MNNKGRYHNLSPRERRSVRRAAEFGVKRKVIAEMFGVHQQTVFRYLRVDPKVGKRTANEGLTERELEAVQIGLKEHGLNKELLSVVFESTIK